MPYDPRDPQRRQALFTLADARGNNPHGTREDAVNEARRLNAQRYETVEQMSAKLDGRMEPVAPRALGQAPPMTSGDLLGLAIGLGLLGAAAFLLFAPRSEPAPAPTPPAPTPPAPTPNPLSALPAPASSTVVVNNPAPVLAVPAPSPVVDVEAVPVKRRRKRAPKIETATVVVAPKT